jgi:hypothetical protein
VRPGGAKRYDRKSVDVSPARAAAARGELRA